MGAEARPGHTLMEAQVSGREVWREGWASGSTVLFVKRKSLVHERTKYWRLNSSQGLLHFLADCSVSLGS